MKNTLLDRLIRLIRTRKVIRHINRGAVVCDLGCDEGHFLRDIRRDIKEGHGLDRRVENKRYSNLTFSSADIEKEIPNLDADHITMLAVLEHLNFPERVVRNSFSSLKPGGKLILTTPAPQSKFILESLAKLRLIDENEINDHKHYFNEEEIYSLFKKAGFRDVKIKRFELGLNILAVGIK